MHHFNDHLAHQREAVSHLAQLSATRTPVRVPESHLSNLHVDLWLETPLDCQSVVVANIPALLDFSISFVVNDTARLEVDPAPAPSLHLTEQRAVAGHYVQGSVAWRQRAQRAHEEHVCSPFHERFWWTWDQPNNTEQDTSSSVTCRCLLEARACTRGLAQNRRIASDFRH